MKFEPSYADFEELNLIDKITFFGWLSDLLSKESPEATIELHKDKITRIKYAYDLDKEKKQ